MDGAPRSHVLPARAALSLLVAGASGPAVSVTIPRPHPRGTGRLLFDLCAIARLTGGGPRRVVEVPADASSDLPVVEGTATSNGKVDAGALASFAQRIAARAPARTSDQVTCLVADDHPIVREAMSSVLARNGFDVVARASDGEQAIAEIVSKRPTVALVDLRLPSVDGLEIARQTRRLARDTAVVLYTGADPVLLSSALESGARGFLLKEAPVGDIVRAVKMVAEGQIYFDPALAGFLISSPAAKSLTGRELEVLRLLAGGCTNEAIGKRLHLSPDTVRGNVRALLKKLNAHTRTEAVARALRQRLIA